MFPFFTLVGLLRGLVVLVFVCGMLFPQRGAAQKFEWATTVAESKLKPNDNQGVSHYNMKTDRFGNTFVLIGFDGEISVGGLANSILKGSGSSDFCLVKYNATGRFVWIRHYNNGGVNIADIEVDDEGNCYITGDYSRDLKIGNFIFNTGENYPDRFLAKFDTWGNVHWVKTITSKEPIGGTDLYVENPDNIYLSGNYSGTLSIDNKSVQASDGENNFISKFNGNGQLAWVRKMGGYNITIEKDKAGNFYMTGIIGEFAKFSDTTLYAPAHRSSFYLCKYSADWKLQWATHIQGDGSVSSNSIALDSDGNSYLTGDYNSQLIINQDTLKAVQPSVFIGQDAFIAKYDPAGKPVWGLPVAHYWTGSNIFLGRMINDGADNFYISCTYDFAGKIGKLELDGKADSFTAKLTKEGSIVWIKRPPIAAYNNCISSTDKKGNVYFVHTAIREGILGEDTIRLKGVENLFLAKLLDSTFIQSYTDYRLSGKVFLENNANCQIDKQEKGLENYIIKIEPGPYYTLTDSLGNYAVDLNKGTYTVSQILPGGELKGLTVRQVCPINPLKVITIDSTNHNVSGINFGNQVTKSPFLKVDVAADRRRRCFRSTTTVKYCNEGYATASNAQVKVTYPPYVIPISASTPWSSKKDSLLTFNIGTLEPGACGTITIVDSVMCGNEAIRGLTQCVKAVITPNNNLKVPDARWDKSEVELKAVCRNNGFVRLTILNSGLGAMADSAAYRIFLDATQVFESHYKLASKDSLSLEVPVNGKTIRLEADLRPYHPDGNRQPSITLEGCGSAGTVSISKGFVNQLPQDDAPEEVAISCLQILDSFDPNDKAASPAGVGQQHLITEEDELEYLVRFQNTGTDVAYKVVVEDTLDEHLDIATLQIGAASHPFTWNVSGQGRPVITWTFNNINLPDSTSNEPGSHGYLRFRIGQKAENALGTTITNQAAITFDYNSPIFTNATTHLLGTIPEDNQHALNAQVCGQTPSQAEAGPDKQLDSEPRTTLQANAPDKGFGRWRLVSGKGDIREPGNPQTPVEGLGIGRNVFEWTIGLCDQSSSSQMVVERVVIPPAPQVVTPAPVCPGEAVPALTAIGTNLKWYTDTTLVNQLAEAASYQPVVTRTDTFFVTQTVDGYQSKAQPIILTIKPTPPAPHADSVGYICGGQLHQPLNATGENLTWYADATLTQMLGKDNHFLPDNPVAGPVYVTQTVDNCQSQASKILLKAGLADLTDTEVVPNVITPNGDRLNDTFRLPEFPSGTCIGDFRQIRVYNRWGKVVFESTDQRYAWGENGPTPGLYYYELRYSNFTYRGGLSVLY